MADCGVAVDKTIGRSRGFGFVTYESAASVELVLKSPDAHVIGGKCVDAKPCLAKQCGLASNTSKKRRPKKGSRRGKRFYYDGFVVDVCLRLQELSPAQLASLGSAVLVEHERRRSALSSAPLAEIAASPQDYQLLKCYHCRQFGTETSCSDCFRRFCWQCVSTSEPIAAITVAYQRFVQETTAALDEGRTTPAQHELLRIMAARHQEHSDSVNNA